MTTPLHTSQAHRNHGHQKAPRSGSHQTRPPAHLRAWIVVAAVSLIASGCGLLFGEDFPEEILVDNCTDSTLTASYRGRVIGRFPPRETHELLPLPVDGDSCLISPVVVRDESNVPVAEVGEGECYGSDRITIVIEKDDLP